MSGPTSERGRHGAKRAALRLATLSPGDRSWILARLTQEQRVELNAQLNSLMAFGPHRLVTLSADVDGLLEAPPDRVAEQQTAQAPESSSPSVLDQASSDALGAVARELPLPALSLLRTRMAPSRRHVLDAAADGRIESGMAPSRATASVTQAFSDLLVRVVERRLAGDSGFAEKASGTFHAQA